MYTSIRLYENPFVPCTGMRLPPTRTYILLVESYYTYSMFVCVYACVDVNCISVPDGLVLVGGKGVGQKK